MLIETLGNLLILIFGDNVEHRSAPNLSFDLFVHGRLCHALLYAFSMGSNIPLVGVGCNIRCPRDVLSRFPLNRVKVFIWFFWFIQVHYLRSDCPWDSSS